MIKKPAEVVAVIGVAAAIVLGLLYLEETGNRESVIVRNVIGVSAQCRDGMYSTSRKRAGTCSGHGGVKKWIIRE